MAASNGLPIATYVTPVSSQCRQRPVDAIHAVVDHESRRKLIALITGYLHLVKSQRKLWRIVLHEAYSLGGTTRKLLMDCRQYSLDIISGVLEEGMGRGEFRSLDPQLASLCLLGIISERVLTGPTPSQEPDAEQLAGSIADILLHGVGAPEETVGPASRIRQGGT